MLKIIRPRQAGKSSELIRIAEETNAYIVVATRERALYIAEMAEKQGRHILFPVTYFEYQENRMKGSWVTHILIDDADAVLQQVFGNLTIDAIAMTGNRKEGYGVNQTMESEEAAELIEECGYKACPLCSKKGRCEDEEKIDTALGMAVDALRAIEAVTKERDRMREILMAIKQEVEIANGAVAIWRRTGG